MQVGVEMDRLEEVKDTEILPFLRQANDSVAKLLLLVEACRVHGLP